VPKATEPPEVLQRFDSGLAIVGPIASQVRRTVGPTVSVSDLESFGQEGLLDAARRYDPTKRVPFRAYASLRIRGAMIDGIRQSMPLSRRNWQRLRGLEAMERLSTAMTEDVYGAALPMSSRSADEILASHMAAMATALVAGMISERAIGESGEPVAREDEGPEAVVLRRELRDQFERALLELPSQEAELIRRHYLEGERFDQVASSLGLSKSWTSRLHRRAIDRLAKRFKDVEL
jgi:RNA polymerase sigma factor for flagellar operon FliA